MDIHKIEQEIIHQSVEMGGFLVEAHSLGKFDEENYEKLISSLKDYDKLIGSSESINRSIAGCLLQLETGLADAVSKYESLDLPVKSRLAAAHVEVWDLILQLLTPPDLHNR